MKHRVLGGKARLLHQALGVGAVEANPAVLPGGVLVRLVRGHGVRHQKEAVPAGKPVVPPAEGENPPPGGNAVNEVMVAHRRPPGVAGGAFLNPAAVHGKAQAAVDGHLEGVPENVVCQFLLRLSVSHYIISPRRIAMEWENIPRGAVRKMRNMKKEKTNYEK